MSRGQRNINFTEGVIWKQIVVFTLPMLVGSILQQTYNMVDSVIVGQFVGREALAAVGSSNNIIMLITSLFMGISMGASVTVARYFGAGDRENMQKGVHTMVAFGLIGGVVLTVVGELLTPWLLRCIGTPDSVMEGSMLYFRIYFAGTLFNIMYNIGGGIFRAVGDSRHPLYYLFFACILNTVLDLWFVAGLGWGVAGAAWATIIGQFVSCVLTFWRLMTKEEDIRVSVRSIRIHGPQLREIIAIGLPSGVQNSIVSLSNVVVQANINSFGALALAGYGAYCKIDGFALMPASNFAMTCTTFVSQNIGAQKYERAKRGALTGFAMNILTAETIGVLLYVLAPTLMQAFNSDPQVIYYGALQARTVALFYCLVAGSHAMAGILRGYGQSKLPMAIMIIFWCGLRMAWITGMVHWFQDIRLVYWAYPVTWLCSFTVLVFVTLRQMKWHGKLN